MRNWLKSAVDVALQVAVLLIILHLPLTLLFSLGSRLMYETETEVLNDTALLVVLYGAFALGFGFILATSAALLRALGERAAQRTMATGIVAITSIVVLSLLPIADKWWLTEKLVMKSRVVIAIGPWGPTVLFVLLFAMLGTFMVRRGLVWTGERLSRGFRNGSGLVMLIVIVAAAFVSVSGYYQFRPWGWKEQTASAAPAWAAGATTVKPPNVILITIDTLADRDMSLYGYRLPTTPGLERIAASASVFDRFYAVSNYTTPTVTTILTGRYPSSHGVYHLYGRVRPEERGRTLAAELRKRGYVTAAVMSNPFGHPLNVGLFDDFDFIPPIPNAFPGRSVQRLLGFHRANVFSPLWDWWWISWLHRVVPHVPLDSVQHAVWYPPERVIADSNDFLGTTPASRPLFLWAHFLPPHDPYMPPAPFLGKFLASGEFDTLSEQFSEEAVHGPYKPEQQKAVDLLRLRYDENIAFIDDAVSRFVDDLSSRGLLANSVLLITADHGESFEKGWRGHNGPMLHDALVHIPLIVKLPGQAEGRRIADNADETDLLPTILDAIGAPAPSWADGESLLPLLKGAAGSGRPKFSMSFERSSRFVPLASGTVSTLQGDERLIRYLGSGCEELYDLRDDPQEQRNRIAERPERATELRLAIGRMMGFKLAASALQPKPATRCAQATSAPP